MNPSEPRNASPWSRIRSVVIVVILAAATVHSGHAQSVQMTHDKVLAGAPTITRPWTNSSQGSRSAVPSLSQPDAGTKGRIADAYGRQPLSFEANRGQTDPGVQFVSRGAGYTLFLTSTEAVLALRRASPETTHRAPTRSCE